MSAGPRPVTTRLAPPPAEWVEPARLDTEALAVLVRELKLPAALCSILLARGIAEPDEAKAFLRTSKDPTDHGPPLADGQRAAARLGEALRRRETIFVHGDYDVDGICGTALLTRWLRSLGGTVVPFVPHRVRDGYDFTASGLAEAVRAGATLIVTVDCGTLAHETVAAANDAGIDVIVTDHHTVGDTLPPAVAVVNPQRDDCPSANKGLCGTAVAFRVAELLGEEMGASTDPLMDLLDLVALATVADLVPLQTENRALVRLGLKRLASTDIVGLDALFGVAEVDRAAVTAGNLGYQIAPRINAAGRLGESRDALELLLSTDEAEAGRLAGRLDQLNRERREEDQRTLEEALKQLEEEYDPASDFGVVLAGEGWHPGVIGIVASRVVERIHRPVVMIALGEDGGRGSGRSIPGFDLLEAIRAGSDHLGRFGGHRQAAGMDIAAESVPAFRAAFNAAAKEALGGEQPRPRRRPDVDLSLGEVDVQLVHWLRYLGPHGIGNPGPLFRTKGILLDGAREVGRNHLKVTLRADGARLDAIGFDMADRYPLERLAAGRWDVLYKVERNEWQGRVSAQARVVDLRESEA